jgi:SpoIID/LytB domain protein
MCQVGALRMARKGTKYEEILQHYYPGTTINKDWIDD